MKPDRLHTDDHTEMTPASAAVKPRWRRVLAVCGIALASLLLLVAVALTAVTYYYTPERLTALINREASDYLAADVETHNVRFKLWRSFPYFAVDIDSVTVRSRLLDSVPSAERDALPAEADMLATAGRVTGGINLLSLLKGDISLKDVKVCDLDINMISLNDSVNNYNIFPKRKSDFAAPFIEADTLRLIAPRRVSYISLADNSSAYATLGGVKIYRQDKAGVYRLDAKGVADVTASGRRILDGFPFSLDGDVKVDFHPVRLAMKDFSLDLGDTRGRVEMAFVAGDDIRVNSFGCKLDDVDVKQLMSYIPSVNMPWLSDIDITPGLSANARLLQPYSFLKDSLPTFDIDFVMPEGKFGYKAGRNGVYTAGHTPIHAKFMFDGRYPDYSYFDILPFRVSDGDTDLGISGRVTDLTANPEVTATLQGKADLRRLGVIPFLRGYNLKGRLRTDSKINFRLADAQGREFLRNLRISGDAELTDYSFATPSSAAGRASGHRLALDFGSDLSVDGKKLAGTLFDASATADTITLDYGSVRVGLRHLAVDGDSRHKMSAQLSSWMRNMPLNADVSAGSVSIDDRSDTISVRLDGVKARTRFRYAKGQSSPRLDFNAAARMVSVSGAADASVAADGLMLSGSLRKAAVQGGAAAAAAKRRVPADADALERTGHTPAYLVADVPDGVRYFLDNWFANALLRLDRAEVRSRHYPVRNELRGVELYTTLDSVSLRHAYLIAQRSAMRVSMQAANLRQFLSSAVPAELRLRLNVALDTVDINQIARAYETGVALTRGPEALAVEKSGVTASDTVAVLLPRNITADITASAKETVYTHLHLYNLGAGLRIAGGDASLGNLRVSADFGHARADAEYRTSDVEKISTDARIGVTDVDVVTFFERFHKLLLMMPEMRNLSGTLSASATAHAEVWPDMYLNLPALTADISLKGRGLKVHQSKFIHRIADMLMIYGDGDIHIADMDVHATVHDNLLELDPFDFVFDRYRLNMVGLNNFNGALYYHIGVLRSPLHFPFGINVKGHFSHPQLRFGGARFKDAEAQKVADKIEEVKRINVLQQMKYYTKEFVHKAALSDTSGNSDYIFGVNDMKPVRR